MRNALHFLLTVGLFAWDGTLLAVAQPPECRSILPAVVEQQLQTSYKGWTVLTFDDLLQDDQELWRKAHGSECPGVFAGHFVDNKNMDYAVLVIKNDAGEKEVKLLVISALNISELYTERHVSNYPVIHKGGPGKYGDVYNPSKSVTAETDVPIYEHIEASAIAFIYKNGKYHRILISD